jgi:hypothetical protein
LSLVEGEGLPVEAGTGKSDGRGDDRLKADEVRVLDETFAAIERTGAGSERDDVGRDDEAREKEGDVVGGNNALEEWSKVADDGGAELRERILRVRRRGVGEFEKRLTLDELEAGNDALEAGDEMRIRGELGAVDVGSDEGSDLGHGEGVVLALVDDDVETFPGQRLEEEEASVKTAAIETLDDTETGEAVDVAEVVEDTLGRDGVGIRGDPGNGSRLSEDETASHESFPLGIVLEAAGED